MKKLLIFAGTTEGRMLAQAMAEKGFAVTASVATGYGREVLPQGENLTVLTGRLDEGAMEGLLEKEGFCQVVDATHPYAQDVTRNIRQACEKVGTPYLRLLRPGSLLPSDALQANDTKEAARLLENMPGNVLLTTGSKELGVFASVTGFDSRFFARMLPMGTAVEEAAALGLPRGHIIAMQGPFTKELNVALIHQYHIDILVTKDGGTPGGFAEKCQAAQEGGARLLLIGRPPEEAGSMSYEQVVKRLEELGEEEKR